jgi:hypothetical protein
VFTAQTDKRDADPEITQARTGHDTTDFNIRRKRHAGEIESKPSAIARLRRLPCMDEHAGLADIQNPNGDGDRENGGLTGFDRKAGMTAAFDCGHTSSSVEGRQSTWRSGFN